MPAKWFLCPDNQIREITKCLEDGGCKLDDRCASRPYLRLIGYDREWKGVSPSSAGNGPRYLYLKATKDYVIDPDDRAFAALGMGTHNKLSLHKYTYNVLSEEPLKDEEMRGIPDVLEQDEKQNNHYILTDYKTWGSFKVAKALGIKQIDEPIIENGKPVLLKSGLNKGKPKTIKKKVIDLSVVDLRAEEYQLNRYRMFFEKYNFPISQMRIQVVSRDGKTYVATNRGIERNIYIIPIKRLPDEEVNNFYRILQGEVDEAFIGGYARLCNDWESWEGRRCDGYCEVKEHCMEMSKKNNEKWEIIKKGEGNGTDIS